MKKPYTIAINSVSGGGKTSLAKLLQESLVASVVFCFDDFDKTNRYPEDFYEWWKRGADLREFDCPGLRKAVDEEIRTARIDFIILDYPFGRDHPRFENLIGLSVFVDTLLDVAMARRINEGLRCSCRKSHFRSFGIIASRVGPLLKKSSLCLS